MIRVVLADDQALVRAGFRVIVEAAADISIVAEAGDGIEAVAACARTRPDVVLLDIRMPRMDGLEAARRILASDEPPKVLLLTTFDVDEYVGEALVLGASGYLLKDIEPDDIVGAIRAAHAGDLPLAPAVTRRLVDHYVRHRPATGRDDRLDRLTPRERDVLAGLGRGLSNAEIVAELHLSLSTVKTHVASILAKLQLRDRVQAAIVAHQLGLGCGSSGSATTLREPRGRRER
jgi:DNA-binding NarL/FixJ family response regulator